MKKFKTESNKNVGKPKLIGLIKEKLALEEHKEVDDPHLQMKHELLKNEDEEVSSQPKSSNEP